MKIVFFILLHCTPGFTQFVKPIVLYSSKEQLENYTKRTFTSCDRFVFLGLDTGIAQSLNDPKKWGRRAQSFPRRFGAAYGKRVVANTAQLGFEFVLNQDTRYRRSENLKMTSRIWYALQNAPLAYSPNGRRSVAYGRISSSVAGESISSLWHPHSSRPGDLALSAGFSILDRAGSNLLDEFSPDLKQYGASLWRKIKRR